MNSAVTDDVFEGRVATVTASRRLATGFASDCRRLCCAMLLAALASGCAEERFEQLDGATMGTGYRITARCDRPLDKSVVDAELAAVNAEMSNWLEDSALSRFNRAAVGDWFPVPAPLARVVAASLELSARSGGALDVTVGPLVDLWGFGPGGRPDSPPSEAAIAAASAQTGWRQLEVRDEPPALRKRQALTVDLSAVAKGHGVDRVAALLEAQGCSDYLVDIGGELRSRGLSPKRRAWRIGVEVPDPGALGAVQRVLSLDDRALATSGDYRNFIDFDVGRMSHTIDPRSGRPVSHRLASVTVAHETTLTADGWATALLVLGPDEGLKLARREGLAALFIERTATGFDERYTGGFEDLLTGAP